jgi:hypothetical protein
VSSDWLASHDMSIRADKLSIFEARLITIDVRWDSLTMESSRDLALCISTSEIAHVVALDVLGSWMLCNSSHNIWTVLGLLEESLVNGEW